MVIVLESDSSDLISTSNVSNREAEILQMISKGYTVKEIASELYLSEHTIISHKKNLTHKLNAKNCVDMIVKAIRMGLVVV